MGRFHRNRDFWFLLKYLAINSQNWVLAAPFPGYVVSAHHGPCHFQCLLQTPDLHIYSLTYPEHEEPLRAEGTLARTFLFFLDQTLGTTTLGFCNWGYLA